MHICICIIYRYLCAICRVALLTIKQFKYHITYNSTQQLATQIAVPGELTPCFIVV